MTGLCGFLDLLVLDAIQTITHADEVAVLFGGFLRLVGFDRVDVCHSGNGVSCDVEQFYWEKERERERGGKRDKWVKDEKWRSEYSAVFTGSV